MKIVLTQNMIISYAFDCEKFDFIGKINMSHQSEI